MTTQKDIAIKTVTPILIVLAASLGLAACSSTTNWDLPYQNDAGYIVQLDEQDRCEIAAGISQVFGGYGGHGRGGVRCR